MYEQLWGNPLKGRNPVRVVPLKGGRIWFVSSTVCQAVHLSDPAKAIRKLGKAEWRIITLPLSGEGSHCIDFHCVDPMGVYALLLQSDPNNRSEYLKWFSKKLLTNF
jgi:prophage antirepressor-like protein